MKIGILGGTFNPIHLGHIHLALEVRSKLNLDEILFIPAGIPPHKTDEELASPDDRFEMVQLAISNYPFLKISDIEFKRQTKSYTIDTVRALGKSFPDDEFFLIIGLDAFLDIESWKESHALLQSIHFVVVSRPGFKFSQLVRLPFISPSFEEALTELDLHTRNRLEVHFNHFPALTLLYIDPNPISSSEIREKIKKGEIIDNNLLPEPVKSFIIKKRIFN